MTKSELVDIVAEVHDQITRREAEIVVNEVIGAIAGALSAGERVELRGFGSFTVKKRDPRIGRNPKTGEAVQVPAKLIPHFKPGKALREQVDAGK